MPDFERIRLRTPVRARFHYRGHDRIRYVEDEFEAVVPALSKSVTTQVATIYLPIGAFDFLFADGRLYRPFIDKDDRTWTAQKLRDERPPIVRLERKWRVNDHTKSSLLGSPWRPWVEDTSETMRRAARRDNLDAWGETESKLRATAAAELRVIDGLLFQETRAPAWFVGMGDDQAHLDFPDRTTAPGMVLLDARTPPREVGAAARRCGSRLNRWAGWIEVAEPSLMTDTLAEDALASFTLWLAKNYLTTFRMTESHAQDTRALLEAAEIALTDSGPFDNCIRLIERIKKPKPDDPFCERRIDPADTAAVKRAASLFLRLTKPPARQPLEIPDEESDSIANGFRP